MFKYLDTQQIFYTKSWRDFFPLRHLVHYAFKLQNFQPQVIVLGYPYWKTTPARGVMMCGTSLSHIHLQYIAALYFLLHGL